MRDLETISTALTAAETGHLVFATLHTQSAPQTIDRIIDAFPAEQQDQVRVQLAATLQGIVTQNLVPTADGRGRVAALEILIPDDAVRNLIRQAKIEQVYSVMQTSTSRGMLTMEQSLADLVLRRVITSEVAFSRASTAGSARDDARARRSHASSRCCRRHSTQSILWARTPQRTAFAWQERRGRHGRLQERDQALRPPAQAEGQGRRSDSRQDDCVQVPQGEAGDRRAEDRLVAAGCRTRRQQRLGQARAARP